MSRPSWFGRDGDTRTDYEVLWNDGERLFCRMLLTCADGAQRTVLVAFPATEHPTPASLDRLTHEFEVKDDLDDAWAARPLELRREHGQTMLVLRDPGGQPLDRIIGQPMEIGRFLQLSVGLSAAVGQLHERGLVHKDIKPSNVLINSVTGQVWLTGFGITSRIPRERQLPKPPEFIAGTLAYMAPEQTGRMNRSIDSRSDLYSLGVTLYQMLTGSLPFTAPDPMQWVHSHIARKPLPPGERLVHLPAVVSAIIMKLLSKTAEERYQTAAGLEGDLRRCLGHWENQGRIEEFPLGEHDTPDRLLIPEKLYGRTQEIETLLASFERLVANGLPQLVLISGYSGIGKSSVVNELHKTLVPPRGLFASGKFDQYKRDRPYSTFAQAFETLVGSLLGKSQDELQEWRDALQNALGPNSRLIVDLIPELKHILGEQSPVPVLPPQDAQRRFQLVFRRFISVFARPEHPLVLFLDDLQWLDAATLDFLEDLLIQPDVRHLLLIGAYRDNEVNSAHPLMRKLEAIRKSGATVHETVLAPLTREDLERLLSDSLCCELERVAPFARLLYEKTAGNPFFAIQFLSSLAEEDLLSFDHRERRWSWDLERIRAKGYTDNVVELMVGKLNRLPIEAQNTLQQLACLGNSADVERLAVICGGSIVEVHSALREAVRAGLVLSSDDAYRFLHDRVQEAAYSLISEESRAAAHLRIGRLLAAQTLPKQREEAIFDIVNHLNRGVTLISSRDELDQLAEFNLIAGKRAKASTAYASALNYLCAGAALLAENSWDLRRELIYPLELNRAECELLTGRMSAAADRLTVLSSHAANMVERAAITSLRVDLYTILDRSDRAVGVCLDYLRHLDVNWGPHPTKDDVQREYDRIWSRIGRRSIEDLVELPLMVDSTSIATLDVLTKVVSAAYFTDEHLSSLVICHMVNLSLEHGNSDGSCFAYVWLGVIAGPRFHNYDAGYRFGRLGYELVEKRGLKRFQARTYMCFGNMVMPWTRHVRTGRDLVRRAFDAASQIGDLTFAAYSCNHLITNLLAAGEELAAVQREAQNGLAFARTVGFGLIIDDISAQLGLIRNLRGLTRQFGSFNDDEFDEHQFERHLLDDSVVAEAECWYFIRKLIAHFLAGDYASAVSASLRAERLLWTSPSQFETAELHFYGGLSHAASWDMALPAQKQQHLEALTAHHRQLEIWASNCPENFRNRAALVKAEIGRIEGRELEAERLYQQAIDSSRANSFVHNEAVASEVAARFYATRGFELIAHAYLRAARHGYLRWGAIGKVRQLEGLYPHLEEEKAIVGSISTIGAAVEQLDLATVLGVSQAVSGEIALDKLIDTIVRMALVQAGAERGLLITLRGDEYQIEAEATTSSDNVTVALCKATSTFADVPETILNYVVRTKERVLLHDASKDNPFSSDQYIRRHYARSVLCMPLLRQTRLVGVLYLENNLAAHVFTLARMTVLTLLASQAAISLENIRLYDDLQDREAKMRRLVESNIIGIFIWRADGCIIDANEAYLRIIGYDRGDLLAGRLNWRDFTPPQWRDADDRGVAQLEASGTAQAYEKEYLRKDGTRVSVLVGTTVFEGKSNEGVGFVLDLTERKHAEESLRESERRYHEAQMELAHANRVVAMGQLSASIAHEVNQPVAAAVINAQAGLRRLGEIPPDLERARQALDRIVANGTRAGEVIGRMRALLKKTNLRKEEVEINGVIREVIALICREATEKGISVQTSLTESLPRIQGDRIQLQQVMLNLVINAVEALGSVRDGFRNLMIRTNEVKSDEVLVVVQDSGPGLALPDLERVFDAFYTTKPDGLGMGLSICRSIVEAHGGRLWAAPNTPNGAVFQFTLPAR